MIKLIDILNELNVNNPNIPSEEEATKLATEFVKTFDIDWESNNTTYSEDISNVNPRLVKFLEKLGMDDEYEDLHNDFRFNIIGDGENRVIAIYLSGNGKEMY